ncbi:MAG TPA: SDR family NAD(P)-dependent oxidoreductase, partial [Alphaproteobacteria bacterium]|nr:SDR family NAD(P)-dependent oxidoreductase [Alphaproteobacteria bacterium]
MAKLQDKTALITGASSGIGAKVALLFADEGADVVVNYPDEGQAENALAVVAEVEKRGRRAVAIKADVSKADENAAMVDRFMAEFGHIDILVNNAGIGRTAMIGEMSVEMWDEMIAVNLRSVFLATNKILPLMYAQ